MVIDWMRCHYWLLHPQDLEEFLGLGLILEPVRVASEIAESDSFLVTDAFPLLISLFSNTRKCFQHPLIKGSPSLTKCLMDLLEVFWRCTLGSDNGALWAVAFALSENGACLMREGRLGLNVGVRKETSVSQKALSWDDLVKSYMVPSSFSLPTKMKHRSPMCETNLLNVEEEEEVEKGEEGHTEKQSSTIPEDSISLHSSSLQEVEGIPRSGSPPFEDLESISLSTSLSTHHSPSSGISGLFPPPSSLFSSSDSSVPRSLSKSLPPLPESTSSLQIEKIRGTKLDLERKTKHTPLKTPSIQNFFPPASSKKQLSLPLCPIPSKSGEVHEFSASASTSSGQEQQRSLREDEHEGEEEDDDTSPPRTSDLGKYRLQTRTRCLDAMGISLDHVPENMNALNWRGICLCQLELLLSSMESTTTLKPQESPPSSTFQSFLGTSPTIGEHPVCPQVKTQEPTPARTRHQPKLLEEEDSADDSSELSMDEMFSIVSPLSKSKRLKLDTEGSEGYEREIEDELEKKRSESALRQSFSAVEQLWKPVSKELNFCHGVPIETQFREIVGYCPLYLSRLVSAFACCPASECSCERLFSSLGRMVTPQRNQLSTKIMLAQGVLNHHDPSKKKWKKGFGLEKEKGG
jgi:hypothetical protein